MTGIKKRTFSLPQKLSDFIDGKVKSGDYASGSEVVRAGLRALQERDKAVQRWLDDKVAPTHDALQKGDAQTHPIEDIFDDIRSRHVASANKS
jgi:antitoxin ParD1/3/4